MPEISIIIPLYNKSQYIAAMLDSVQKQTFSNYELIVIDDGSTDESGQIAEEYAEKDSRIRVIHISNSGVSHARNIGLDLAEGKYITFIDADDTVAPEYLENLYTCITENDVDLVISGITKYWRNSDFKETVLPPYQGKKELSDFISEMAMIQKESGIYGYCVSKIFPFETVKDIRFDEELQLAEDFDYYLKILSQLTTVYFDKSAGYFYQQETENSQFQLEDDKIDYLSQLKIQLRFAGFLKENGAFCGQNQSIIEQNISDYIYFSLHHVPIEDFDERFSVLREIYLNEKLTLRGRNCRQKATFYFIEHNNRKSSYLALKLYRSLRKLFRR